MEPKIWRCAYALTGQLLFETQEHLEQKYSGKLIGNDRAIVGWVWAKTEEEASLAFFKLIDTHTQGGD